MKKKYSRRELQGWGVMNHQVVKHDISFLHVEVIPGVREQYGARAGEVAMSILEGLGLYAEGQPVKARDTFNLIDVYEDLREACLRYISFLELNR